jgi:hypothetical protein
MTREVVTAEELLARAESNGYKTGAIRDKTATETHRYMMTRLRRVKIQR